MVVRILPAMVLAAIAAALPGCQDRSRPQPVAGVDVTEVSAAALETALKEQKGKVVLVDCWATWCAPCVKKFPHLVELHEKYHEKGLVCVSVSMDKYSEEQAYKKDKVLDFLHEKKATFPNFILLEPKKDETTLTRLLGDYSLIPYMVLYDRSGRRVWSSDERPRLTDEQLAKKIEELLADK